MARRLDVEMRPQIVGHNTQAADFATKLSRYEYEMRIYTIAFSQYLNGVHAMTVNELLPSITPLSQTEKFRLVQIVLRQLAEEKDIASQPTLANDFDPRRYFGVAQHTRQAVDDYLASAREGWN